jgi:hypothetical protein
LDLWTTCRSVLADIFRSRGIRGSDKVPCVLFVMVISWFGVQAYIRPGVDRMQQHRIDTAQEIGDAQRAYLRGLVSISPATELWKPAGLEQAGVITEEEFLAQRARALKGSGGAKGELRWWETRICSVLEPSKGALAWRRLHVWQGITGRRVWRTLAARPHRKAFRHDGPQVECRRGRGCRIGSCGMRRNR